MWEAIVILLMISMVTSMIMLGAFAMVSFVIVCVTIWVGIGS